jgi:hypothetical protein
MNNMEYEQLCDSMVKHQIKQSHKLNLELITQRAWMPCPIMAGIDFRVEYLNSVLWARAMDIEDDEESEALKAYISVMVFDSFMPATPPQYADFKMNSIDNRGNYNAVVNQLNTSMAEATTFHNGHNFNITHTDYGQRALGHNRACGFLNRNVWNTKLKNLRAKTLMRLSYSNYEYAIGLPVNDGPLGQNRRYEVMFIRYLIYLELCSVGTMSGNLLVSALFPANARRYNSEIFEVKHIALCDGLPNKANTGLKPITATGFRRLCVDRELICVWAACYGPVGQPLA